MGIQWNTVRVWNPVTEESPRNKTLGAWKGQIVAEELWTSTKGWKRSKSGGEEKTASVMDRAKNIELSKIKKRKSWWAGRSRNPISLVSVLLKHNPTPMGKDRRCNEAGKMVEKDVWKLESRRQIGKTRRRANRMIRGPLRDSGCGLRGRINSIKKNYRS